MRGEVDPVFFGEFLEWREKPTVIPTDWEISKGFLGTLLREDISPALKFPNSSLVTQVRDAVHQNSIWIEALADKDRSSLPRYTPDT